MGSTPCPGCGIAVTVGYARCPRCHAPMPSAGRMMRASAGGGTSLEGGGTSVAASPDGATGNRRVLIAAVAGIGLIVAAVLVARSLGRDRRAPVPAAAPEAVAEPAAAPVAPPSADEPIAPSLSPAAPDPAVAAAALARALAAARLFGTVEVRGDTVEIRSAACSDGALAAELARYAADLRAGGVTTARCRELHGAEVFARPL